MKLNQFRQQIARQIKEVRLERRLTQRELAKLLDITQARYSQIENGKGSFSAEQLIILMKHLNIPLSAFQLKGKQPDIDEQLQKALHYSGADELYEDSDVLPSERLEDINKLIVETIVAASSARHIMALIPIIIKNASDINLDHIKRSLNRLGLENRLGWIIDGITQAIDKELQKFAPRKKMLLLRRALVAVRPYVSIHQALLFCETTLPDDILDRNIASQRTLDSLREKRDPLAKKWNIVTAITLDDFIAAIRRIEVD